MKSFKTSHHSIGIIAQLTIVALFSVAAQAANPYIRFDGTVIEPPPCTINGGTAININFGDTVIINRVDGSNYIQDIAYNLDCTSLPLNTLRLQIKGTAAGFDGKKLATNITDFGIGLTADGKELAVNQWLNFINTARPVLKAVPVKKTGATIASGKFTAAATMMVDYQ